MASAAFIEALPVIEFVAQLLGKDAISRPLSDSDRVKVLSLHLVQYSLKYCRVLISNAVQIKKSLRGVKVEVTHRGSVRRKYRVSGLTSEPTRQLV